MCLSKEGRRRQYMPLLAVQTPLHFHGIDVPTRDTAKSEHQYSLSRLYLETLFVCKGLRNRTAAAWSTQLFLQRAERKFQNPGVVPSVLPPAVQPADFHLICDTLARYNGVLVSVLRFEPVQVVSLGLGATCTEAKRSAEGLTAER